VKMVKWLLEKDSIDPNSKDNNGRTPLSWAVEKGNDEVVGLLLEKDNIDLNSKDKDGRTLLWWAAGRGRSALVNLLLAKERVNPDSKDKDARTPLSLAAGNGHSAVVNLLLAKDGVNPESLDKNGRTPLWWAAENEHEGVMNLLISKDSVTLHMLVQDGNQALVQFFLHAGYDVNACDSSGMTPLRLAVRRKDRDLIEILLKNKAHIKDIMAEEWRSAYGKEATDIVQLAEGSDGANRVCFPVADELSQTSTETERRLLYVISFLASPKAR
jgi:ankyrin repeat protein